MRNKIDYIIIQAGGKGTRMNYLTFNKPKCLISIKNKPMLFYLFEHFPKSKFIIIADYKKEILKEYLKIYAKNVNYQIVEVDKNNSGTLAGIKKSLEFIPINKPFIITWSDLLFLDNPLPKNLDFKNNNYVGLSSHFTCRWRFKNGKFEEKRSKKYGVAGFFIFSNKKQLSNLPERGEFVKYLKNAKIKMSSFNLLNTDEIGAFEKYIKITKKSRPIRPFNKIEIKKNAVVKIPTDKKGEELSILEKNFYKNFKQYNFRFLPRVIAYSPLTLEKINGKPLFYYKNLTFSQKKEILKQIVNGLKEIHQAKSPIKAIKENDYEAIIGKTRKRLNEIESLIPFRDETYMIINQKKCLNFLKKWEIIEKIMNNFYPSKYVPIHGDLTFSNTLYSPQRRKVYFIDPRGYYGKIKIYGDADYDWAKVYYSLKGNYDQFNIKNFILEIRDGIKINIDSNGWENLEDYFFQLIETNKNKILFYHGIIWLSLTTYAWDNVDSILGAFYNGIYLLNQFYEQYKKTF
jgi:choline kinase/thiamine kinase-like enzyme